MYLRKTQCALAYAAIATDADTCTFNDRIIPFCGITTHASSTDRTSASMPSRSRPSTSAVARSDPATERSAQPGSGHSASTDADSEPRPAARDGRRADHSVTDRNEPGDIERADAYDLHGVAV